MTTSQHGLEDEFLRFYEEENDERRDYVELKRRRWFTLWWTIGIASLIAITVLAYKTIGTTPPNSIRSLTVSHHRRAAFSVAATFSRLIGYLFADLLHIAADHGDYHGDNIGGWPHEPRRERQHS